MQNRSRMFWSCPLQLCLILGACLAVKPPAWPQKYRISGVLQLPYAELHEPFTGWYNAKIGKSRIDYYGDMVKTIQVAETSKLCGYGAKYKIAPMSTEKVLNVPTCFMVNGTRDVRVSIQPVLPELSGFKYIGDETFGGRECKMFQSVTSVDDKVNTYTLWVETGSDDPVRYTMIGYDSLLGSHYDRYYINYKGSLNDKYDDSVFVTPLNKVGRCAGFPDSGDDAMHWVLMNPLSEYVSHQGQHVYDEFDRFTNKHGKKYIDSRQRTEKLYIFRENLRYVHSMNRAGLGYSLALNHLADWSREDLRALRGSRRSAGYNGGKAFNKAAYSHIHLPEQIDWRLYGAVTPVKDQSVCGSCWSFGTTGAVEGAYFLKTGHLVRLSQQELVDCSWGEGNNGCDGGVDFRAYQWIMRNGGLATEDSYGHYLAVDGYCHAKNVTRTAEMTGYVNVTSNDAEALKAAMFKHGPISVAIDASHLSFRFYSHGVYYEPKCGNKPDELDHVVLAVGYGTMHGTPYWLVKNSWSTYWGNDGYVLMSQVNNNCGVATDPTFVTM